MEKEAHGDQSAVFRIRTSSRNYFLKIASDLKREREKLEWLDGRLPVPKIIDSTKIDNKDALLSSALPGKNLAVLCKEWPAEKIVEKLAEVLKKFHSVDVKNCPFGKPGSNKVLISGDACLPNFIFQDEIFSGYIDLGDMKIGNRETDLSAAVWSLQYNLGKGHGLKFLKKYGIENADEDLVEKLRLQYEDMQRKWGL